ncbi:unnamed protein product [Paramecium sonneborni]|uniref:Uncharacterized protein n=1 Tax=Paramecium sonneborni TaxID=65129 RepID=A0A8S1MBX3_9CILI|nr:unnamed protein product [Paramecium sonneborni]
MIYFDKESQTNSSIYAIKLNIISKQKQQKRFILIQKSQVRLVRAKRFLAINEQLLDDTVILNFHIILQFLRYAILFDSWFIFLIKRLEAYLNIIKSTNIVKLNQTSYILESKAYNVLKSLIDKFTSQDQERKESDILESNFIIYIFLSTIGIAQYSQPKGLPKLQYISNLFKIQLSNELKIFKLLQQALIIRHRQIIHLLIQLYEDENENFIYRKPLQVDVKKRTKNELAQDTSIGRIFKQRKRVSILIILYLWVCLIQD